MKSLECSYLAIILCFCSFEISKSSKCGDKIIRGVNLGGRLLWEPWITPSIFEDVNVGELKNKVVDEWTYAQYIDPERSRITHERYVPRNTCMFYVFW